LEGLCEEIKKNYYGKEKNKAFLELARNYQIEVRDFISKLEPSIDDYDYDQMKDFKIGSKSEDSKGNLKPISE